jgi:hypothetical protein
MSMRIEIVKKGTIRSDERQQMYSVFSRYYENVDAKRFDADLETKDWIIQLRNDDQVVVGFSTLQAYEHRGSSGDALILYSGDTIVDRAHRTNGDLAGAFGHLLMRAVAQDKGMPIFWLLTSKGARTYRFLPVFFNTFFPVHDQETPEDIKLLVDEVALAKFGTDYSPSTQIVSHHERRDWLCASEHDPSLLERDDPHIRFFLQKNPGYARGDELVCLTEMSEANLNARARRVITHTEVQWRE